MPPPGPPPLGECMHPAFLAATAVLAVNDWLLKPSSVARWGGGALTGKLSDLAGLVIAPLLITSAIGCVLWLAARLGADVQPGLTRRRAALAIVVVGVGFAAVKLSPACAHQVARLLGPRARIVADPTDLLALPALALAWWIARSTIRSVPAATAARPHPS